MATTIVVRNGTKIILTAPNRVLLHRDTVTPATTTTVGGRSLNRRGPYQVSKTTDDIQATNNLVIALL